MSCQLTPELIADRLDKHCSLLRRNEIDQHINNCAWCSAALTEAQLSLAVLSHWQEETVPDWQRQAAPVTLGSRQAQHSRRHRLIRQSLRRKVLALRTWAPLAASVLLALAVLLQLRIDISSTGMQLSFGSVPQASVSDEINTVLTAFAEQQRIETRQLVEVALLQFGDSTADSLQQLVEFFEQQRELDLRRMEAGMQQLLDRNYQTVNSVQLLASYIQSQETAAIR